MFASPDPLAVEINKELYALDKIPDEQSAVVLAEKSKLLGTVDLETLVEDLGRVGGFIRIAYNAVGAAGHKFTNQQIEIQRLGFDITKLCDKSALTVAKFKKASETILTDLQSTYGSLLITWKNLHFTPYLQFPRLLVICKQQHLNLRKNLKQKRKR